MMIQCISQKKGLVCFLILAFIILINAEFLTGRVSYDAENRGEAVVHTARMGAITSSTQQKRFENLLSEGKRLMQEEFDYEGAIQKFNAALDDAVTSRQKSEVYFFLSLSYYATLDARGRQAFENAVQKLIEVDYHRTLDKEICPPRYIEWYQKIKKEYGAVQILSKPGGADLYLSDQTEPVGKTPLIIGIRAGETKITLQLGNEKKEDTIAVVAGAETLSPVYTFASLAAQEEKPIEELPEVAVQEGVKKKGSSKTMLYVLGGIVVAGGAAAALLLGGGGNASTGSIQVSSTPQGAKILLDGSDTMKVTNAILDNISAGSHIVRISLDDYADYEETVTVTAGETAIVNAQLTKDTIEVTAPTANDTWQLGGDVTITWTTSGSSGTSIASQLNRGIENVRQMARLSRMRYIRSHLGTREISAKNREMRDDISSKDRQRRAVSPSLSSSTANERSSQNTLSTLKNPRNESADKLNVSTFHQKYRSLDENQLLTVRNVKIELHQTGFGWRYTIADNTSNTGSFSWSVPTSLGAGSGYFVRISSVSDPSVTGDSEQFSIVSNATANNE